MGTFTVSKAAVAALKLVEEQASHIANTTTVSKFTKSIALDVNPFKVGDMFRIPKVHKVFKVPLGRGFDEYCFVPVLEEGATEMVTKQFRPASLTKRVHEVDINDLSFLDWQHASGTVVDLYRTGKDAEDGIQKVIKHCEDNDKSIKVSAITPVTRFVFGSTTETEETSVLTFDFA